MFEDSAVADPPVAGWSDEAFARLRGSLESGSLLLDLVRREQRVIGAAQARRARWIAGFCRSRPSSNDRPATEIGAAAAATRAARPSALTTVSEWAVDEIATALSVTATKAQAWTVQSLQLTGRLPATLAALDRGELTWEHATAMCEVVAPLDDDVRPTAEARLLDRLGAKTPTQLRAAAHRVVQRLDGQAVRRRVEATLRERGIAVYPTGDGLGTLAVTDLPLPVLRALQEALRQYADAAHTPADARTRQQRMADCLVDLVLRPGEHGLAPVQAQLTVLATVRTLTGGDEPGEVGGDVVPAETVRALARALGLLPAETPDAETGTTDAETGTADADTTRPATTDTSTACTETTAAGTTGPETTGPETTGPETTGAGADVADRRSRAVASGLADLLGGRGVAGTSLAHRPHIGLVDELTGQLLALTDASGLRAGRALGPPPPTDAYSPSAELARHVQRRDRRCRFPGCRRPGRACDLHHVVRFPLGQTSAANLCCLCRHHHRLVHQAPGWQLAALPDGGLRFTTPTGQQVLTYPDGENAGPPRDGPPDRDSLRPAHAAPPGDDPPPF